jgi:hypothetical protein
MIEVQVDSIEALFEDLFHGCGTDGISNNLAV